MNEDPHIMIALFREISAVEKNSGLSCVYFEGWEYLLDQVACKLRLEEWKSHCKKVKLKAASRRWERRLCVEGALCSREPKGRQAGSSWCILGRKERGEVAKELISRQYNSFRLV